MGRKQKSPSGIVFRARVAQQTPEKLEKLAASMGHLYGGKGKPGALLDMLASGDLVLVPKTATDVKKSVAQFLEETSPSAVKLDRKRGDGTQTIPAGFRGRQTPPNLYRQMFSSDRPASKNSAY